jgi:hypothetical protein
MIGVYKMDILKDIDKALDNYLLKGKKIKNFNFSLLSIKELEQVRKDLKITGKAETIDNIVYRFCMYCGLKTITKGIGWKIFKQSAYE